jgi:mono/diheme cytochrome c family protein
MSWPQRLRAARLCLLLACSASVPAWGADAKVEAGATIYGDYCSNCHGDELRNTSGGVTFDLRRLRPEDHDRFVNSVLDGKRQMPAWRGVLDQQKIEAVWAFIRAPVDGLNSPTR